MPHLVKIDTSKTQLEITAGPPPTCQTEATQANACFDITVVNNSQRFASFQIDLSLEGTHQPVSPHNRWYRVEPEICAKKPPGASTQFRVMIEKAPLPAYGQVVPIRVQAFSVEYEDLRATQLLELKIHPPESPIKFHLPFEDLKVYPGDRLNIPVIVTNLTPESVTFELTLLGESAVDQTKETGAETETVPTVPYIHPDWFAKGMTRDVTVPPGDSQVVEFSCLPPTTADQLPYSRDYRFALRAAGKGLDKESSGAKHVVEILPYGTVQVECTASNPVIAQASDHNFRIGVAEFPLQITNQSNLTQQVTVLLKDQPMTPFEIEAEANGQQNASSFEVEAEANGQQNASSFEVEAEANGQQNASSPENVRDEDPSQTQGRGRDRVNETAKTLPELMPHDRQPLSLKIEKPRPWLGWGRRYPLAALTQLQRADNGVASHPIQAIPEQLTLEMEVRPIVPGWMQIVGGLVGMLALATTWWLNPKSYHLAPVNSVRLIGNETTVVSGSSDQTLRRWDVVEAPLPSLGGLNIFAQGPSRLWHRDLIAETGKAIRVIRESPFRDGQIAVGLESGDIELWEVSPPRPVQKLFEGSDRVFDLDFTPDARYLFSGHGSGLVRQWDLQNIDAPPQRLMTGIAISAVTVLEMAERSVVAIAGQYNTLLLWDWEHQHLYRLHTTPHQALTQSALQTTATIPALQSKDNYITSLATTPDSTLLAAADNRGYVNLWDVEKLTTCLQNTPNSTSKTERDAAGNSPQVLDCGPARLSPQAIHLAGQAIRAIALSEDGCYLTTAGDNGQLQLWPLTAENLVADPSRNSISLAQYPDTPIRSVDIKQVDNQELLIVANGPHNRVNLYRHRIRQGSGVCNPHAASDMVTTW